MPVRMMRVLVWLWLVCDNVKISESERYVYVVGTKCVFAIFFFFYLSWRVNFFWVFKHFFSLFILFSSYLSFVFIILFIRFTIFFIFFFFLRIFSFHSNPPKMNWMFCILLNGKKIKSLVKCTVEVEKYGALTKKKPYLL